MATVHERPCCRIPAGCTTPAGCSLQRIGAFIHSKHAALRRHNLLNAAFLPVFSVIIPSPTLVGCINWSLSLSFRTKLAFLPFSTRGKNAVLSREFRVSRNLNRNTKNSVFVFLFRGLVLNTDERILYPACCSIEGMICEQ